MRLSQEQLTSHLTKLYTLCPSAAMSDLRVLEAHLFALNEDPSYKVSAQLAAQIGMLTGLQERASSLDARIAGVEGQLTQLRRALLEQRSRPPVDTSVSVDPAQHSGYVEAYMARRLGVTRPQARALVGMGLAILSALSYLAHEILQLRAPSP